MLSDIFCKVSIVGPIVDCFVENSHVTHRAQIYFCSKEVVRTVPTDMWCVVCFEISLNAYMMYEVIELLPGSLT